LAYDQEAVVEEIVCMMQTGHIEGCKFEESGYRSDNGDYWKASTLYEAAKQQECELLQIPIEHLDWTPVRFGNANRICDFAYHYKRASQADVKIPILLGPMGSIMDGMHRLAKAIAEDVEYLSAYRLTYMPPPDETKTPDD